MPTIITRGAASALAYGWSRVSGAITDAYFKYVTMLLPGNGTNGAQNNTFLDSSTNNFTITRNGNTTQGTFSPYGSNWSNYLTSSSGYLRVGASANLAASTNSFTIEFWYLSSVNANGRPAGNGNNDTWGANKWIFANQLTGKLEFFVYNYSTGTAMFSSTSTTVAYDGQWHHIAITRSGNTWAMFIDGTRQGASVTSSVSLNGTSSTINVGWSYLTGDASAAFAGYISNFRFVNGSSVYDPTQSTITVPTGPLTAITNTAFLSCQNNRFVDNSTNAFAITPVGAASVQRFSPFSPSAAYSAATIGGSGYFDGSGDSLTAANNTALQLGSTYTTEVWVYPTAYGANLRIWTDGSAGVNNVDLYVSSTGVVAGAGGSFSVTGFTLPLNAWTHIAVVVNAGSLSVYINGTSRTLSGTTTGYNSNSTSTRYFGAYSSAGYDWPGYISDIRFVKGTAVYTANFTPPTSPLTAISGTSILLSMQNAGVIDNAMMNDLETVSTAQISTTQSKFGGSSIKFNGTSDYLNAGSSINLDSFGDFTIEAWIYPTASADQNIIARWTTGNRSYRMYMTTPTNYLRIHYNNDTINLDSTTAVTLNTWSHVAATRSGSNLYLFLNGTSIATATSSTLIGPNAINTLIGATESASPQSFFNGYIDDVRITKGYARYTANFTPPTAAFPTS
jgi:hypothetical protein